MNQVMQFVEPSRQFIKDSTQLVKRCTNPNRKKFPTVTTADEIGFAIMGLTGFSVKLIPIPVSNILVDG
ncbi:protein transport protein Sec61 subunit gamma-like [Arvicanthis niloticus]|uniref:protein transport protein Sec61 subunit gamma-like n=1 Tax=Arvicanthis niloticus TaxID=61156 RepID=UPI001486E698|nr:protein transport protein Sec61 subunit gamma-like [Arvicanthis niloticus]